MKTFKTRSGRLRRVNKSTDINDPSTIITLASINTSSSYILYFEKINKCDRLYSPEDNLPGVCYGAVTTGYFEYLSGPNSDNSDIYYNISNNVTVNNVTNMKDYGNYDNIKKMNILNEITYSIEYDSNKTDENHISYKIKNENKNTVLNKLVTLISEKNNQIVKQDKFYDRGFYQIFTDEAKANVSVIREFQT